VYTTGKFGMRNGRNRLERQYARNKLDVCGAEVREDKWIDLQHPTHGNRRRWEYGMDCFRCDRVKL
jgi:hypothetical protein